MAEADVLYLVNLLSNGQADPTVTPDLYFDIVAQWGDGPELLTNASQVAINPTTEFQIPSSIINVIGMIYDDRELGELTLRELEMLNPEWRNATGKPSSYTNVAESAKTFALYPTPRVATSPMLGVSGEPLGADYPTNSIAVIHTEQRQDVMYYLELPLALLILEREFSRESDHRDTDFAQLAGDFGRALLTILQ